MFEKAAVKIKNVYNALTRSNDRAIRRATSFDGARFRDNNYNYQYANNFSADKSQSREVRTILRNRSREETFNNAWAFGAGQSLVSSVVGTGAKLQISNVEASLASEIEKDFQAWSNEIGLVEKLRAMRFSKFVDGESFAILHTNEKLKSEIKLDVMPIDCDRVTSLDISSFAHLEDTDNYLDGITLDKWGNPVSYRVLKNHPGGNNPFDKQEAQNYSAQNVLHWFKRVTSEQHRGIPEITPALDLFNSIRRYTAATVKSAEIAADIAFCLYTDSSDAGTPYDSSNPVAEFNIRQGHGLVLPESFRIEQLDAKQPAQQYGELIDNLLAQVGACLGLPRLIMRKSAAGFNYAGARVDLQAFYKFISQEQEELIARVLTPIFNRWFSEYKLLFGLRNVSPNIDFFFEGEQPVDETKVANAIQTNLETNTTTLLLEFSKKGLDWETCLEQRAKELAKIKELETRYNISFGRLNGKQDDQRTGDGNDE